MKGKAATRFFFSVDRQALFLGTNILQKTDLPSLVFDGAKNPQCRLNVSELEAWAPTESRGVCMYRVRL